MQGHASQGTTTVKDNPSIFTIYDYVCSGVSKHTFRPVGEAPDVWTSLVNRPDPWTSFYSVPELDLLRSLLPLCGSDEGHWKNRVQMGERGGRGPSRGLLDIL